MANVKITDLTAASTPLAGTELFETVQGGVSVLTFGGVTEVSYVAAYNTGSQLAHAQENPLLHAWQAVALAVFLVQSLVLGPAGTTPAFSPVEK